jgi:UDP-N-acetylglucosamine 2-epimerase (non-hydrolysing)
MRKIHIRKNLFQEIKKRGKILHLVLIATKPDIIKQAPLILELKKEQEDVLIVHSGQHYDWNLSGGLEKEFGIVPDINLNVSGSLYQQQSQIIERLGSVLAEIKKTGRKVLPYIYGDTTTAVAGGIASFANLMSTAHVEAGLRTMSPSKETILSLLIDFKVREFFDELQESSFWKKGSYEPYPEQFDTRAAAPSAGIHFAPTRLNAQHLLAEGYPTERVYVVGNPVADAIDYAKKRTSQSKIFTKFPILKKGNVIRFCIHRRENVSCYQRFTALYEAMIDLVVEGRTVLFISLGATEKALKAFRLKRKTMALAKKHQNFIYSPVWPSYIDVISVMEKCCLVATDSGSIQEETNMLGIPGAVLRFNSDRPEAIFAGANILVPPIKKEIVLKIIRGVADDHDLNKKMRKAPKLYGEKVSQKIIKVVKKVTKKDSKFNLFDLMEHERLGLDKKAFWRKGETTW